MKFLITILRLKIHVKNVKNHFKWSTNPKYNSAVQDRCDLHQGHLYMIFMQFAEHSDILKEIEEFGHTKSLSKSGMY